MNERAKRAREKVALAKEGPWVSAEQFNAMEELIEAIDELEARVAALEARPPNAPSNPERRP